MDQFLSQVNVQSGARRGILAPAFTLVELLVVMAIILLIIGLGIPAFNSIKGGKDITTAAYDISGTLEQARAYAMANRTYVWVGFFEEDGSKAAVSSATTNTPAGTGRVVMSVVASKDGTRYRDTTNDATYPMPFGANDPSNLVPLAQLNKLIRIENTHLVAANVGLNATDPNVPERPIVSADYQVGDPQPQDSAADGPFAQHLSDSGSSVKNPTVFYYPVGSASAKAQYIFIKIIEINPQGEASKIVDNISSGTPAWMEIAVVPARGSVVDPRYAGASNATKSAAVIQFGGLNGRARIFRP